MKKSKIIIQISFVLFLICNFNALGQDHEIDNQGNQDYAGEDHDSHFHPNHIAIFTGATSQLEEDKDTDFTLGVDYVRRFSESGRWGIGVFGEVIFGKHTEWLFGIPVYFSPFNNFWLRAGPALEIHEDEMKSDSGMTGSTKTETETGFALRTGFVYDIEVYGFTLGPNLSIDFFRDKTSLAWGLNIGKGF